MKKRIKRNNLKGISERKRRKRKKLEIENKNIIIPKTIFSFFLFIIYLFFYKLKKETETILSPYIKEQKEFCENKKKYYNQQIEDILELVNISINDEEFKMYTPYKGRKSSYRKNHCFEKNVSLNFISALK